VVRSAGKRETERKRRTTGVEFENRVNGASEGGTLWLLNAREKHGTRIAAATALARCAHAASASAAIEVAQFPPMNDQLNSSLSARTKHAFHKNATSPNFQS